MARPKGSRNKKKPTTKDKGALRVEKTAVIANQSTDDQKKTPMDIGAITPEQQAIIKRVEAETAEWAPINERDMEDFSLSITPLDLRENFPEAWKEQQEKRYAFRWCTRNDKRIDELTRSGHPITRWKLCTRTTTPFLAKYVDGVWGCITRLDQVLLFRPWERHELEKRMKNQSAEAQANASKPENVAMRRAQDGIEAYSGSSFKTGSNDEMFIPPDDNVEEDTPMFQPGDGVDISVDRQFPESQDIGDLVVES